MPPRVTRQWHVLRPLTPAWRHRLQRVAGPRASGLRPYSTTPDSRERSSNLASVNSAIIIPSSVASTKPADLINHITPVRRDRVIRDRFLVFLVTPSFAPWLLDDAAFLREAVNKTYSRANELDVKYSTSIHALCAVVDKLPAAQSLDQLHDIENLGHELQARSKQPPVSDTGFEGLAYVTLHGGDRIPTPEASQPAPDQAALSFVTSRSFPGSFGHFSDTLRLPLANTVFQTGSPSTMIYSKWVKKVGEEKFELSKKKHITHHGIRLPTDVLSARSSSTLAVPLIPLTFPRRVEASMGNILRQITGPDGETIVASNELEKVVPQFFSARGETAQATTVWALVMSKDILAHVLATTTSMLGQLPDANDSGSSDASELPWENLWAQRPPAWNELVPDALAAGARLHRVLSGGGGWGKKAGLLSLDPAIGTSETPKQDGAGDGPGDLSSALHPVVRNGEYIQFFTSPAESVPRAKSGVEALKELGSAEKRWHWELGTIPSTVDALTTTSSQHEPSAPNNIYVLRNSFGALTEGGLTLSRHFKLQEKDAFSDVGTSKVDVPFSRYSAVKMEDERESSEVVDKKRVKKPIRGKKTSEVSIKNMPNPYKPEVRIRHVEVKSIRKVMALNCLTRSGHILTSSHELVEEARLLLGRLRQRQNRKIKPSGYIKNLTRVAHASGVRIVAMQNDLESILNANLPKIPANHSTTIVPPTKIDASSIKDLSKRVSSSIGRIEALRKEAETLLGTLSYSPISLPESPIPARSTARTTKNHTRRLYRWVELINKRISILRRNLEVLLTTAKKQRSGEALSLNFSIRKIPTDSSYAPSKTNATSQAVKINRVPTKAKTSNKPTLTLPSKPSSIRTRRNRHTTIRKFPIPSQLLLRYHLKGKPLSLSPRNRNRFLVRSLIHRIRASPPPRLHRHFASKPFPSSLTRGRRLETLRLVRRVRARPARRSRPSTDERSEDARQGGRIRRRMVVTRREEQEKLLEAVGGWLADGGDASAVEEVKEKPKRVFGAGWRGGESLDEWGA